MPTVHLLTKNNFKTIKRCLDSIQWADRILIADLGSTDETLKICEQYTNEITHLKCNRNEARNYLISETQGPTFYIEPWEALAQGVESLNNITQNTYASVLHNKTITKEIRAWSGSPKFVNPVYETIDDSGAESDILFYSSGRQDHADIIEGVRKWKEKCPTSIAPYYYEACTYLSIGQWQQFLKLSEHYMFLDKSTSMSAMMNRYYYSLVNMVHLKKLRPVLQNMSLCLSVKPLMSEFWCLAADAHYHINKRFDIAKQLYENAIILGSKRLKNDKWPMDLTKYKSYPSKMIESCDALLSNKSLYVSF